jgi:hypothetical protein
MSIRYRQRRPEPNGLHGLFSLAVIAYTFAGFFVYWRVTGSTTVGVGGTVDDLGELVWFGPLLVWGVVVLVLTDRGPLGTLYQARVNVGIDADRITWTRDGRQGSVPWSDVAGIDFRTSTWAGDAAVWGFDGQEIVQLPNRLSRVGAGPSTTLMDVAVALRPDLFVKRGGPMTPTEVVRRAGSSPGDS